MSEGLNRKQLSKIYEKLKSAKLTERGVYLEPNESKDKDGAISYSPAEYTLKVLSTKVIETRESGDAFVSDVEVVKSDNPKHPAGSKRNVFMTIKDDTGFSNMKQFLLAAVGVSSRDQAAVEEFMTDEGDAGFKSVFEQATQEDGLGLADCELNCRVVRIITKKNQKPFNRHDFSCVDEAPESEES